jgi:RNA polymerase sigma-70 factor (ECF subfamily)
MALERTTARVVAFPRAAGRPYDVAPAAQGAVPVHEELVVRAAAGDREAFAALVRGVADRLFAVAWRVVRDVDAAEDAVQAALIAAWDDLPALRDPARFEAWAYRLTVRAAVREARRLRHPGTAVRLYDLDGGEDPDPAGGMADRDEVARGFAGLTPEHRAVLVLRYYVGLAIPEIAECLAIPVGTAKSRLHYGLQEMRAALEADARLETAGGVAT